MVLIDNITIITWSLFLATAVMFLFIRRFVLKLISFHQDAYSIMADIVQADGVRSGLAFDNVTSASAHFVKMFYNRRENMKLTTGREIDPYDIQKIGEDAGFMIPRLEAEQLARRLSRRYPYLVHEILMRAPSTMGYA